MFREFAELKHVSGFKKTILPLSIAFFFYTFGWGVVSPMFSIFINDVTNNLFLTGVILSLTTMMGIFLNLPFGVFGSRLKIKRILQVSLVVYAIIAVLYPMAGSILPLIFISIVRGVSSSFLWLTSWSYVFYYTHRKDKGEETGFFSSMNDLASAVSPILGGAIVLLAFFGPFYVLSATSIAALVIITFFIKENPVPVKAPLKTQFRALAHHMKNKHFIKTVLIILIFYALINVYYSFIAVFLNGEGISIFFIGVLLTISLLFTVLMEVPIGNLIDKYGVRKILSLGVIFSALTGIALVLSENIIYLVFVLSAFTLSYTIIFIAVYSRMDDIIKAKKVAMTGAIATFKDAGYTIGPLLAGLVMLPIGIKTTFLLVAIAFIALLPITLSLKD